MTTDTGLDARLREIVMRHTVVGAYPDTMAIAREAYALDRAPEAHMALERTVWNGDTSHEESRDLDRWIVTAPDDDLQHLLNHDLRVTDDADQALLAKVWHDAGDDLGDLLGGSQLGTDNQAGTTYHWGEGERRALRKAVEHLRPGYLDPHPGQGSLL